jgi:hypothetical protein
MGNPSCFGTLFKIHVGGLSSVCDRAGAGRKAHGTRKILSSGFLLEPLSPIPSEAGDSLTHPVLLPFLERSNKPSVCFGDMDGKIGK